MRAVPPAPQRRASLTAIARLEGLCADAWPAQVEHWRRNAVLQSDPAAYRHAVRHAAELLTGQPIPEDEPLDVTRAKAGM
ncbi:MAG: hypothetical protein LH603_18550 [Pseudonocardia sp.]|nr:hypothetical protein [Pseudonocardia sp.]